MIPDTFTEIMDRWHQRNIIEFGQPKQSGDDCHETLESQTDSLLQSGFSEVTVRWQKDLWGVLQAEKT